MTRHTPWSLGLALVLAVELNAVWAQCPKECCQDKGKATVSCPACKNNAGCRAAASCCASPASPTCCHAGYCACCKAVKEAKAAGCCADHDATRETVKATCGAGCIMLGELSKTATQPTTIIVISGGWLGLPTTAMPVADPIAALLPINPLGRVLLPSHQIVCGQEGINVGMPLGLPAENLGNSEVFARPPAPEPVPPPAVCAPPREGAPAFTVSRPVTPPVLQGLERTELAQPAATNMRSRPSILRAAREDGEACLEILSGLSRATCPSMNRLTRLYGVLHFAPVGERIQITGKQIRASANRIIGESEAHLVLEGNVQLTQEGESPTKITAHKVTLDLNDGRMEIQSVKAAR